MTEGFRLHGLAAAKKRHREPSRNGPVTVIQIDPLVWACAMELADGDAQRIRVLSATAVIVTNQPRHTR